MKNIICDICNNECNEFYTGAIRDGAIGKFLKNCVIYECSVCKVQRLDEKDCIPDDSYENGVYREKLNESLNTDKLILEHDRLHLFTLNSIYPTSLRGKFIMDVGCGAGSLLNMLKNISQSQIGVEPTSLFRDKLNKQGYKVYSNLSEAIKEKQGTIDFAFSIQVIEHVKNPREFLEEIRKMMKPGGKLIISTPNRDDILMNLLKDKFYPFFYRSQHRWYFDEFSLKKCAEISGFKVTNCKYIHRYGMANMLYWLRDKTPQGLKQIDGIDATADSLWQTYLESTKQSDNLYIELSVNS